MFVVFPVIVLAAVPVTVLLPFVWAAASDASSERQAVVAIIVYQFVFGGG